MYNRIIEKIKEIYHKICNKKVLLHSSSQYLDINNRETRSYKQIKIAYEILRNLFTDEKHKIYISGGAALYLLLNQDSGRLHDDIDTIAKMEDMWYFRKTFQEAGLYNSEYDSKTFVKDGSDYGFEIIINGVPVGIYPFTYEDKKITQYTYEPYTRHCKIKELEVEELSDYIMTYKGIDGRPYNTMSMEYIKFSKDKAGRPKDIIDSERIKSYGIRQNVYNRLQMFKQIQDIKAEKLVFINGIEKKLSQSDFSSYHMESRDKILYQVNEMWQYGISSDCAHLHLVPKDLHQMLKEKGVFGTMDTINLLMLDAIDMIKTEKNSNPNKFQGIDFIYMISPIFYSPTFIEGKELDFLRELDFLIHSYNTEELNDENFTEKNEEAKLATKIFGKNKNIATAKIGFDIISSEKWQEKKKQIFQKILARKGILETSIESAMKLFLNDGSMPPERD